MAATICEIMWVTYILRDFKLVVPTPIHLFCDNQAAIHIARNPIFHERTKHLDIDCHFVRDKVKEGFILLKHVSSENQLADPFTKALANPLFHQMVSKLGLLNCYQAST